MQGAVSGFLWIQNDRRYRTVEFGRNKDYWKSRLRAGAFAFAYSEAEELGPLSEATVGATQSKYPQQGFVDHVITPTIGLGWLITEDMLDKYIIKRIEMKVHNPYVNLLIRGSLNPSRSMSNIVGGRLPWARTTRGGVFENQYALANTSQRTQAAPAPVRQPVRDQPSVPSFEFSTIALAQKDSGAASYCIGGAGSGAFRLANTWQLVAEAGGCKMMGVPHNTSGDSLHYMVGPRWTVSPSARLSPYAEVLVGGQKVSIERVDPAAKAQYETAIRASGSAPSDSAAMLYLSENSENGFALKAGGGLNMKLNSAFAIRIIGIDYMYSTTHRVDGSRYGTAFQVTGGMVLRLGTW